MLRMRLVKRPFDILGALAGLAFVLPFAPFISLAIIVEDGFPVLIRLPRVSKGKVVQVYKFRSMVRGAHEMKDELEDLNERSDGPFFKIQDDPRLTTVGKWLRKFRIDEFPQLLNVLRGELSLVGPRPHEPSEVEQYPAEFSHIPESRAGVTGLSQVSGASGLHYRKELELDSDYLANQSLWLDIRILFRTVFLLLTDPTGV